MAKIFYFANLVDQLMLGEEETPLPDNVVTVRALLAWLRSRGENWERVLADTQVRVTLNKQFAALDSDVKPSDEIAIIPLRF